jgi:hypothetical protein
MIDLRDGTRRVEPRIGPKALLASPGIEELLDPLKNSRSMADTRAIWMRPSVVRTDLRKFWNSRTFFISSRLAVEAGMFSREETAKQNHKFKLRPNKLHHFSDKIYLFGLSLKTQKLDWNINLTWPAESIPAARCAREPITRDNEPVVVKTLVGTG